MKWLTCQRQLVLGIVMMAMGNILSAVTGVWFIENLGWILFGLLFLFHPVWSENVDDSLRVKTCVRTAGAVVILIGCCLRVGGEDDYWQRHISDALSIDVSSGVLEVAYDDHGGFQGDGTSYAVLLFSDEELEQGIAAPGGWNYLPLNHTLETLIYGTRTEATSTGPFLGVSFPKVTEGYWYFYDRQGETEDESAVLNRNSYNYTFAVYDAENDRLYFCEYDT